MDALLAIAFLIGLGGVSFAKRAALTRWWSTQAETHAETLSYARASAELSPLGFFLFLLFAYKNFKAGPPQAFIFYAVAAALVLFILRVPRAAVYGVLLVSALTLVYTNVQLAEQSLQDAGADRDEAVEIGARALLQGQNPWEQKSSLGLPITTGPTSILVAAPFVAETGNIARPTFVLWALFLLLLVVGDLRLRNGSFPVLMLLLVLPISTFLHTLQWALDELYWGAIASPFLWFSLERRRYAWAGFGAAAIFLSRVSYVFLIAAVFAWWLLHMRPSGRDVLKVCVAGVLTTLAFLLVYLQICGSSIWHHNFLNAVPFEPLHSSENAVSSFLARLVSWFEASRSWPALLVMAMTALTAFLLRRHRQPFLIAAVAMLLAHTVAFSPFSANDYALVVAVPAMYGVAYSSLHAPEIRPAILARLSSLVTTPRARFLITGLVCVGISVAGFHALVDLPRRELPISGASPAPVPPIKEGVNVRQEFTSSGRRISEVSLMLTTYARTNRGRFHVRLQKRVPGRWSTLRTVTLDKATLVDNEFRSIAIEPAVSVKPGQKLAISVEADGDDANAVTWWTNPSDSAPGKRLTVNGRAMQGNALFAIAYPPGPSLRARAIHVLNAVSVFEGRFWNVLFLAACFGLLGALVHLVVWHPQEK